MESAAAKINLALHVTGRRDDGYHEIETLAVFTAFGDRLTVTPGDDDRFDITGPFASSLSGTGDNLVLRARDLLRRLHPADTVQPVSITLEKALPVASGIGGGSADAAAALRALGRLWALPRAEWREHAWKLGADVAMCVESRPLIARGIGDRTDPIAAPFPDLHLVLVNPGVAVATPEIFSALARRDNPPLPALPARLDAQTLLSWLRGCRNDLQEPAVRHFPVVGKVLAALDDTGAALSRMSGSGATCFGLYRDAGQAASAASLICRNQPGWFVVSTFSPGTKGEPAS